MRKAENLDPLSLIIKADLAEALVLAHYYDESIRQSRKAIEMDPNFALAHNQLAQAYLQKHMNHEAVAELEKAVQLSGVARQSRLILLAPTSHPARGAKR
jgi:tetratricopeptide (TPR) repeat protein